MVSEGEVVARVRRITETRLRIWVGRGWIKPAEAESRSFTDADVARAALIRDLEDELGFDEETVPVLLHLIDQIHGLRQELAELHGVFDALPQPLRDQLRATLGARTTGNVRQL